MSFVLDASPALALCFDDEAEAGVLDLMEQLRTEPAWVPAGWKLEVAQALWRAERRGRLLPDNVEETIELAASLPVVVDDETSQHALGDTLDLARTLQISTYDASYVELARRRRLPLATLDRRLSEAARSIGVGTVL